MLKIVNGSTAKPVSARSLVAVFKARVPLTEGFLFTGYPALGAPAGSHHIDALLVSKKQGVIVFDLVEGAAADGFVDRQNENANKLEARLRQHERLMCGRTLQVPVRTVTFAPTTKNCRTRKAAASSAMDPACRPGSTPWMIGRNQTVTHTWYPFCCRGSLSARERSAGLGGALMIEAANWRNGKHP